MHVMKFHRSGTYSTIYLFQFQNCVIFVYANCNICRDCADMILKFHKAAGKGKLTVAYEKYSRKELGGVAAVKPLDRLPC